MNKDLLELLNKIHRERGVDFTLYRTAHLERRLGARLRARQTQSYNDYIKILDQDPEEYIKLFDTLFIHVSHFFRDPKAWDCLRKNVLPEIIRGKEERHLKKIRIWCAGISMGQEVYTVAILLKEALGKEIDNFRPQIYGTDVDHGTLMQAMEGRYTEQDLREIGPALLHKYFQQSNGIFTIDDSVRLITKFMAHNLVTQPSLGNMNLILCRNVLIYFSKELQAVILEKLYRALQRGGYLMIGKSESLPKEMREWYEPVSHGERIYRKGNIR
ncbi:MAG: protein-glutamate O-methyltransferase CheR [Deltaproteobacteria bacterium]|nr:protein-glutamate O-methyltransferase CheR [Deltaproteobacteria bacterium]